VDFKRLSPLFAETNHVFLRKWRERFGARIDKLSELHDRISFPMEPILAPLKPVFIVLTLFFLLFHRVLTNKSLRTLSRTSRSAKKRRSHCSVTTLVTWMDFRAARNAQPDLLTLVT
jgi:hypothetical protein